MDAEPLTRLWPLGAVIVLVIVAALYWAQGRRTIKIDVLVHYGWNGGHGMGAERVPSGISVFCNYIDFAVADNKHIIFCGLDKHRGCVVWKGDRILFEPEGTEDYGAPRLHWRSDGALLLASANEAGDTITVYVVPGVNKATG